MKRLKSMKDSLIACAQDQMGDLVHTDTKELGDVIDMIKDLEEAIYYCCLTESMKDEKESKKALHKPYKGEELEEYLKDLSEEITEMVQNASQEEKSMLRQKLSTLVNSLTK